MIAYAVLLYLVWFVHAPWWLYVPVVTGIIIKCLDFLIGIFEVGKESNSNERD